MPQACCEQANNVMRETARVSSVRALQDLRASFAQFGSGAEKAILEVDIEIQRTVNWLHNEQTAYWQREIRRRHDKVEQAKADLRRAQMTISDRPPAAVEQKKALKNAQAALDEAQEKARNVERWKRVLEHEIAEYKGQVNPLMGALDSDLPRALAWLDRMMQSIESYIAIAPPAGDDQRATGANDSVEQASYMARSGAQSGRPDAPELTLPLSRKRVRKLQVQSPSIEALAGTPIASIDDDMVGAMSLDEDDRDGLEHLRIRRHPPDPNALITMAGAVLTELRCFLFRAYESHPDHSGWFIGYLHRDDVGSSPTSTRTLDLLQRRPDLRDVLALPRGSLVVLSHGMINAVYDAEANNIWNTSSNRNE